MESAAPVTATPQAEAKPELEPEVFTTSTGALSPVFDKPSDNNNSNKRPQPALTPANILRLQRTIGNRAVQRLLKARSSQPVQVSRIPAQVQRDDDDPYQNQNPPQQPQEPSVDQMPHVQQVVQSTDIEALDNVPEDQPLPPELNELGANQPEQQTDFYNLEEQADQPPGPNNAPQQQAEEPYGGGGGTVPDDENDQGQPVQGQPVIPSPFEQPNGNTSRLGNYTRPDHVPSGQPKEFPKYDSVAPLKPSEENEDLGYGSGIATRENRLVNNVAPLRTRYITDREERRAYRIYIEGGVFKNAEHEVLDSAGVKSFNQMNGGSGLIFVMSRRGKMYAADMVAEYYKGGFDSQNKQVLPGFNEIVGFHHSSFKEGKAIAGAGELVLNNGKLQMYSDASGHYQPGPEQTMQVLTEFQSSGVILRDVRLRIFKLKQTKNRDEVNAAAFHKAGGNFDLTVALDDQFAKEDLEKKQKADEEAKANLPENQDYQGNQAKFGEAEGKYKLTIAAYTSAKNLTAAVKELIKHKGKHFPVGHTWVILKDKRGKLTSFGFMPASNKGFSNFEAEGEVVSPDNGHKATSNYDYELSARQYIQAFKYAMETQIKPPKYGLFTYNCTTFASKVAKAAGMEPPNSSHLGVDAPNILVEGIEDKKKQDSQLVGLP